MIDWSCHLGKLNLKKENESCKLVFYVTIYKVTVIFFYDDIIIITLCILHLLVDFFSYIYKKKLLLLFGFLFCRIFMPLIVIKKNNF